MTYDEAGWPTHSDATNANNLINNWANWGVSNGNLCKGELFVGSSFYGWKPVVGGTGQRISYRDYINGTSWSNRGDLPADVQSKAIYTRDNGFGGVFIWELGYDVPANQSNSLLKAIHEVMPYVSGSSTVCNTNTTFTLHNRPNGSTISWSKSNNLAYVNGQGTGDYIIKAATSSTSGNGWVEATVSSPCGNITLPRENVWVGRPNPPTNIIFHPHEPCLNQIVIATAFANNPAISGVQYTWWGSHTYINMNPSGSQVNFTTLSSYPYSTYVYVRGSNVCGNSANYSQLLSVKSCGGGGIPPSPVVISPNPTSTEVNVNVSLENSNDLFATSNNFDTENYEIAIYNISGVIMYKARMNNPSLKIDVSNWIKGVYVVKIINGSTSIEGTFIVE